VEEARENEVESRYRNRPETELPEADEEVEHSASLDVLLRMTSFLLELCLMIDRLDGQPRQSAAARGYEMRDELGGGNVRAGRSAMVDSDSAPSNGGPVLDSLIPL
jgi:hypothetical protein